MDIKSVANCSCQQGESGSTKASQQLGLDELMIVNPSAVGMGSLFEGEDGALYQMHGVSEQDDTRSLGMLFLGDDGAIYRAEESKTTKSSASAVPTDLSAGEDRDDTPALGGYLLAADGTIYEITN